MEEDFDIYEDLHFGKKKHEEDHQVQENCGELTGKIEKLEERVKHLETDLTNETNRRKILETNFSSLLKTAKNELSRKDRIISDLRAQIDNFYFRRNKVHAPVDDGAKNNSNKPKTQKDPELISKCKVEEKQEKADNLDKSLPVHFSPVPQLISQLESLSDDENMEIICQPTQLTSTVFGERLKKRLKDQDEKERLQMEQAKLLTSIPKNNEIVDNKTEVKSPSTNNMDNKENQYRLISLDMSPKKNLKRGSEEKVSEVLNKRKKYVELSDTSQSCKNKKTECVENSGNCTDKFINTNIHTNEYFCSVESGNNSLENVDKYQKKSPEHDTRVHSSKHVDDQRDDRYCKKYWNNEYRDNRSKSRNRMNSNSEKNYSYINRGRSKGRGKPYDGRGRRNYYNKEDDFNRDRSRSYFDLRSHIKQWQHNEVAYENDVNERRYPDEKIYGEVRRSRRIEARSHSHHAGYKKDSDYHYKDHYKNRQCEEKNRTRRRSKSRERSRETNSADSMSLRKNDSERIDDVKEDRIELNKSLEDGEILDNQATNNVINIINNIFEGNETIQSNVLNPIQSPKEERIENIQEFIQKFDVKKEVVKGNDKNAKKNTDNLTDNTVKMNGNKDNHHNEPDNSKQEKKENVQKVNLDQQLVNTNIQNNKKVNPKEDKKTQKIVTKKNDQPQDPKLKLPSDDNSKSISNNVELKENKCDTNKVKTIQNNEDKNNLDKQSEAVISSTIKQKPKIIKIDTFTATRDPEYCKILSKYLKKKPDLHNSASDETCTINVIKNDEKNTQNENEKNVEVVHSKQVENLKSEKCEKEKPLKVESDKCIKLNSSAEKLEELSSSSTSSALKIICKPEPIVDLVDEKVQNNECFVSPIPKNPIKRTANKNKINVKKPNISNESEARKIIAPRKKKEKVDENQNLSASKGVMIVTTRRRAIKLSDFSSSVTAISTIQNVDSNQISKTKLETINV